MLGIISRARTVIDTVTVNARARGTRLPGQCQISGVGVLGKQSGNEDQQGGEPGASEKSCKTMEFIVNAVVLSTDRAHYDVVPPKKAPARPRSKQTYPAVARSGGV